MSQIEKRLQALESKQQQVLGCRAFYECDPGVFREGDRQGAGPTYSREALSKLSSQGWQLILVHYTNDREIERAGAQTTIYIPDNGRR